MGIGELISTHGLNPALELAPKDQRTFLPVPWPPEKVDAVKWRNLPQALHCRRTAKARRVLEDHSNFLQCDHRPVCTRAWFSCKLSNASRA